MRPHGLQGSTRNVAETTVSSKGSDDMTTRVVRAAIEDKLGSKQRGQLHAEPFIFAVAVLLQLIPLAIMPYVITTDGPSHVAAAWVLEHYSDANSGLLRKYYQIDLFPSPNLLTECLLAGLMRIVSQLAPRNCWSPVILWLFRSRCATPFALLVEAPDGLLFSLSRSLSTICSFLASTTFATAWSFQCTQWASSGGTVAAGTYGPASSLRSCCY